MYSFNTLLASIRGQNKSGFFGGPAFIHPIRTIWKDFKKPWLAEKKAYPPKKSLLFWSCKQAVFIPLTVTKVKTRIQYVISKQRKCHSKIQNNENGVSVSLSGKAISLFIYFTYVLAYALLERGMETG